MFQRNLRAVAPILYPMTVNGDSPGLRAATVAEQLVRENNACSPQGASVLPELDAAATALASEAQTQRAARDHHLLRQPFIWPWTLFDYDKLEDRYTFPGQAARDLHNAHDALMRADASLSRVTTAAFNLRRVRDSGCR